MIHHGIQLGSLLKHLQALGELPLRGDEPAVTSQPLLAAFTGEHVDPVCLGLRGVVAPELDERMGAAGEPGHFAEWCSVGQGGDLGAGGEIGADADDFSGVDTGHAQGLWHGDLQHAQVVGGHLQRPLRGQGFPGRQGTVEHRVWVVVHGGAQLLAVADTNHDCSARERAEVDTDDRGV